MRRFTRRRNNGIWFPTQVTEHRINAPGNIVAADVTPLIAFNADRPPTPTNVGFDVTLNDVTGGGYLIKRIVGSVFAGAPQVAIIGEEPAIDCARQLETAFAIWVDRNVDELGQPHEVEDWDPFTSAAMRKRFLFRRVWRLTNGAGLIATGSDPAAELLDFPHSNAEYGSIREATHVDVKVKARVSYEERLFMGFFLRPVPGTSSATQTMLMYGATNLRLFGTVIPNMKSR